MKVCINGAGAIGRAYRCAVQARFGVDVSLIARGAHPLRGRFAPTVSSYTSAAGGSRGCRVEAALKTGRPIIVRYPTRPGPVCRVQEPLVRGARDGEKFKNSASWW